MAHPTSRPRLHALASAWVPAWLLQYRRTQLGQDLLAGAVVAVMLVPQSIAYALLAGLPAQYGLYASMLPLLAYAWLGSSMTLAVGPVAVTSLFTASALAPLAAPGSAGYIAAAALLALMSGAVLVLCGVLRLGFIAKLLSNPVISGFTSGAALLIVVGQLGPLLGVTAGGSNLWALLSTLAHHLFAWHGPSAAIGLGAIALLLVARQLLTPLALCCGAGPTLANLLPKLMPMLVMAAAIAWAHSSHLSERHGIAAIGAIPQGLPPLQWPQADLQQARALLLPACLLALINFVSSIAVAQALAARRKQHIDANAELRGLGAANIASAISGALPVSGGFARSLVAFSAGAQTPLAGVISALLMALIVCGLAGGFSALPLPVMAAIIIAAIAPVIDVGAFRRAWRYDRADAVALAATAAGVLLLGVEAGIAIGVGLSLASLVWRSSHPHIAVLGRVPFTEHFLNVLRYKTETLPQVLALRIDENLLFANAQAVEERVRAELEVQPAVEHVLLVLSSVSQIDTTGLDMLLELNSALRTRGIALHLAEVKGPVLDRLHRSPLPAQLSGKIFLSTHQAFVQLAGNADDYVI